MAEAKKASKSTKKAGETKVKKATKAEVIDGDNQETNQTTDTGADQGIEEVAAEPETEKKSTTKAGKRSPKAVKEAEELQAKEERKAASKTDKAEAKEAPKPVKAPTRTRLERAGKKFRDAAQLIEKDKEYGLKEAVELAVKTSPAKFDATVEVHVRLNVDPRQADQNIRDNFVLPEGTGKAVRVAVFAEADDAAAAKKAGADIAAGDELLKDLDKGKIDFDILIATPAQMAKLGKYARVLGPKGLMPNPKSGTVTTDVAKAVQQSKAGRVEYRVDSTGIVHLGAGKVSFGADKLEVNIRTVFASIKNAKPASLKGTYVKAVHLSTSMGPSIKVLNSEI